MPDPTTTYITTAAVPEWAAEVTGDARDAEIERLRAELSRERTFVDVARNQFIRTRESDLRVLNSRDDEIASLKRELADVKAECCRLTDRNGDMAAERGKLRSALGSIHAIATTGFREIDESVPRYWFERIQGIAAEAISPPKEAT